MLSVTVLVKNAEATLADTLRSLESFSEVILLDTGSTDQTLAIAGEFPNVKIFHAPFQGFGPSHNLATSLAAYDFVLSLDSDEILSDELIRTQSIEFVGITIFKVNGFVAVLGGIQIESCVYTIAKVLLLRMQQSMKRLWWGL
jgi:glycosyltransferase involved in cell wall biosynthesis